MMKYAEVVRLVNEILTHYEEATIRQVYYRLVSPPYQYMDNTRSMYNSFDMMMVKAREQGLVDWRRIADHTRTTIKPEDAPCDSMEHFIKSLQYNIDTWSKRYAIDMWANQSHRVKVFIEKDALAQIVADVALPYQVEVIPGRGYGSFTQIKQQAEALNGIDKPMVYLYFGDFDPSGLDIDRSASSRLSAYSGADFQFARMALTEADVADLPPNPTKSTDRRSAAYVVQYGDRCWELDALPPDVLRNRVKTSIELFVDKPKWTADIERLERDRKALKERIDKVKV